MRPMGASKIQFEVTIPVYSSIALLALKSFVRTIKV